MKPYPKPFVWTVKDSEPSQSESTEPHQVETTVEMTLEEDTVITDQTTLETNTEDELLSITF